MHNFWLTEQQIAELTQDQLAQSWLLERSSITLRLKSFFPNLAVEVLAEGFIGEDLVGAGLVGAELTASSDELAKLDLAATAANQAWLRSVLIHNQGEPLIYARTLIPNFCPENPWQQIEKLGNKPLGEILFSDKQLQRSEFEFCEFDLAKHLSNQAWLQADLARKLLARRCVFSQQNQPLLLTEVFLNFAE